MVRTLKRLLMVGALAFLATPSARADFDILISGGGLAAPIDVVADGFNTSANPNTIQANVDGLNGLIAALGGNFSFSGLSANDAPSGSTQQLGIVGNITGVGTGITITASATDYTAPAGATGTMTSTTSDSYSGGFSGKTFTSFYDPTNTLYGTTVPSTPLVFAAVIGTGSASNNGTAAPTLLGTLAPSYALTNTTVINLVSPNTDQFTGITTVVRSVPEPSSMALMVLGGTTLVARLRRRKVEA